MTNRRAFIQAGAAFSAAVSASSVAHAAPSAGGRLHLHRVVFDARFLASQAFGEAARGMGAHTALIQGDVTRLWQGELDPQWREAPVAIAGLTTNRSFYTLEVVARVHGMRAVFVANHVQLATGEVEHRLVGPSGIGPTDFLHGSAWPSQLAQLVMRWPAAAVQPLGVTGDLTVPSGAGEPLVSWVIAPIVRV